MGQAGGMAFISYQSFSYFTVMALLLILNIGLQEWTETCKIHWPIVLQYFLQMF